MSIEKIERVREAMSWLDGWDDKRTIESFKALQSITLGDIRALLDELSRLRARVAELEAAGYGKPVIRQVERAPLVYDDARDDERCRWPECTCYGPQAPNHCKRQTRRTLDARALSEREGQE